MPIASLSIAIAVVFVKKGSSEWKGNFCSTDRLGVSACFKYNEVCQWETITTRLHFHSRVVKVPKMKLDTSTVLKRRLALASSQHIALLG